MKTPAERLGIRPGSVVWLVGDDAEGATLLDPLPEGAELYETEESDPSDDQRWTENTWGASFPDASSDEDDEPTRPQGVDVAVLVVTNSQQLVRDLDEVLPNAASIPDFWVCAPDDEVPTSVVEVAVEDYGWIVTNERSVDDTWTAWSITQA